MNEKTLKRTQLMWIKRGNVRLNVIYNSVLQLMPPTQGTIININIFLNRKISYDIGAIFYIAVLVDSLLIDFCGFCT